MSASKTYIGFLVAAALVPMGAQAVQGLNASSQTKVNNALAKGWANSSAGKKDPSLNRQVVNIGSKRGGNCNVNVGTAQAGKHGRQPKEIVVTTKEVINVCK